MTMLSRSSGPDRRICILFFSHSFFSGFLSSFAGAFFVFVIYAGDVVFNAGFFFSFLSVVPAIEGTYEVTGDAAEALKRHIAFFAATGWTDVARDDAGEATDWIAVYWVVDGTVTNTTVVHFADDSFEGVNVLGWIAIKLDVSNVTSVTKVVIWSFDVNLVEC